jgi:two-component system, NtrC family, C4-dicarboxylate transport sensor histidine kinase DctB
MLRSRFRQLGLFACAVGAIGLSAFASQHVWRENGLKSLQAANEPRLQLIAKGIYAEINRQDHLPVVLSLDADVRQALASADGPERMALLDRLDRKLTRLSAEADTRAMFVINPQGKVVASDDWEAPDTLVGRDLADRPYFAQALATGESTYLGVEPSTNRVRYYLARAIRENALLGVAVVRIEFDTLESDWEMAGEHVLVTDSDGVVFLSSDPSYRYRGFGRFESPMQLVRPPTDRYLGAPVDDIDGQILERRGSDQIIRITSPEAGTFLSQATALPEYGWTIHRLTELTSVDEDQRDGGIIGGSLSALIIILALYVVQRQQAYLAAKRSGAELQRQVAERTHELSDTNASLQTEIEERRRTEARLRATQNELVQAGKLAALGQMSAAIAHEINQPLAAIRTFMASTKIFAQRGDVRQVARNLDLITDLAERMASITGHLKTFARKSEPGHPEPVAVERAIERTLILLTSQIRTAGVRLEQDIAPDLQVTGHAVQLEQVILNLVGNALDAVADADEPWIRIRARASGDMVAISVADNGHGIAPDDIDRIFDPFFTTKPLGKGLGLGLSISYGIVQDFGGQIHAANRPEGGAELTVELPRHRDEPAAKEKALHA